MGGDGCAIVVFLLGGFYNPTHEKLYVLQADALYNLRDVHMPYDIQLNFVALWIEGVYFANKNWNRLRTIGEAKNLQDDIAELAFFPVRQRTPAQDEQTNPEMKDSIMAEILESYNSVGDLCDFIIPPYQCNLQQVSPDILGEKLKYSLRVSNTSNPNLFQNIARISDNSSILDRTPKHNPYIDYVPIIDVHAYDNLILIAGGPIANANDWPQDYSSIIEVDYFEQGFNFRGIAGENIILPSTVENKELGELVKSVWDAKRKALLRKQ